MTEPEAEPREQDFLHLRNRRVRLYRYLGLTLIGLLLATQAAPRGAPQLNPTLIGAFVLSFVVSVIATGAGRRTSPLFIVIIVAIWAVTAWLLRS